MLINKKSHHLLSHMLPPQSFMATCFLQNCWSTQKDCGRLTQAKLRQGSLSFISRALRPLRVSPPSWSHREGMPAGRMSLWGLGPELLTAPWSWEPSLALPKHVHPCLLHPNDNHHHCRAEDSRVCGYLRSGVAASQTLSTWTSQCRYDDWYCVNLKARYSLFGMWSPGQTASGLS